MDKVANLIAKKLLSISAIQLQPDNPFTWGSGWSSPIYTDNRRTLSYPEIRSFIKIELCRVIIEHFEGVQAIAGVSGGAIAQGVLVAEDLNLPYAYVRATPKDHGLENLIEGNLKPGQKVVVVEDLLSTGASSLKAVKAIRDAGCEVIGIVAIFSFEFPAAQQAFRRAGIEPVALSNYHSLIKAALETNYLHQDDVNILDEWRKDPENWVPGR